MNAKLWLFEAIDTLFFRDGTPFQAGETDARGIRSIFPPAMSTLQGAIRAALAMGQGWTVKNSVDWPDDVLGSFDNIGCVQLQGPYLALSEGSSIELLFPFPASVVKHKEDYLHLVPGEDTISTDLSLSTRLMKSLDLEDITGVGGLWLKSGGMEKVLSGQPPQGKDIVPAHELWDYENRVGIEINPESRTVKQGGLYSLNHVRLNGQLRLAAVVSGVPDDWHQVVPRCIPLGGESRMASIKVQNHVEALPRIPELTAEQDRVRFTVTLITPGHFGELNGTDKESIVQVMQDVGGVVRKGPLKGFGDCVSACVPKLKQVGGWDIVNRRPRPLRPVVIPGSTWFYEVEGNRIEEITALHGSFVGQDNNYGYGQILIGKWGC